MRADELIIEDDERTKAVAATEEKFEKLLLRDCSEALQAYQQGHKIYKGLYYVHGDFYKTNPRKIKRKSKNTHNYYTLLFDNLSLWRAYPKRSRSLICANDKRWAGAYGNTYLIMPFNGANIGICPNGDIWNSFMKTFGRQLYTFTKMFANANIDDNDYKKFLTGVLKIKRT